MSKSTVVVIRFCDDHLLGAYDWIDEECQLRLPAAIFDEGDNEVTFIEWLIRGCPEEIFEKNGELKRCLEIDVRYRDVGPIRFPKYNRRRKSRADGKRTGPRGDRPKKLESKRRRKPPIPWQTGGHDARHKNHRPRWEVDGELLDARISGAEEVLVDFRRHRPIDAATESANEFDARWQEAMTPCTAETFVDEPWEWAAYEPSDAELNPLLREDWADRHTPIFDLLWEHATEASPQRTWDAILRAGYRREEIASSVGGSAWYAQELDWSEAQAMRDLGARAWSDGPDLETDYYWRQRSGEIPQFLDRDRLDRILGPIETWFKVIHHKMDAESHDEGADADDGFHDEEGPHEPVISDEEIEDIANPIHAEPPVRPKTSGPSRSGAPRQLKQASADARSPQGRQRSPATHLRPLSH